MEHRFVKLVTCEPDNKVVYVPFRLSSQDVASVQPYVSTHGAIFKNVSTLEMNSGSQYTIVGNYKDIGDRMKKRAVVKGFKRW